VTATAKKSWLQWEQPSRQIVHRQSMVGFDSQNPNDAVTSRSAASYVTPISSDAMPFVFGDVNNPSTITCLYHFADGDLSSIGRVIAVMTFSLPPENVIHETRIWQGATA